MPSLRDPRPERPQSLVSWKEIAAFLNRAERTVKRWERDRGLPVHRVPGGERGGVFAYPDELEAWLLGQDDKTTDTSPVPDSPPAAIPAGSDLLPSVPKSDPERAAYRRFLAWTAGSCALLGLVILSIPVLRHFPWSAAAKGNLSEKSRVSLHVPAPTVEDLYLQGRYQWSLRTAESLSKSIDLYTQAIVLDPAYAQAYAGLAESYELLPEYSQASAAEQYARAEVAANRAIELDPNLAAGHRARAFALFWGDWDWQDADEEFRRAIALAPNEMETHHWYAAVLMSRNQRTDSLEQADQALRLGPTNPSIAADVAFIHASFYSNREDAINTLRELARTQPSLVKPSRYLARLDLEDGQYQAYLDDLQHDAAISHNPDEVALAEDAARGWASGGKTGMFEGMREAQQAAFDHGNSSGYTLAKTYLLLGRPNDALHYFKAAFDRNDFNLMTLYACECISGVKNSAGYVALLRQVRERTLRPPASKKLPVAANHL